MSSQRKKIDAATRSTLVITNAIKVGGLVAFMNEALSTKDSFTMAMCLVMMTGAQGLEGVLIRLIERFFAVESEKKEP